MSSRSIAEKLGNLRGKLKEIDALQQDREVAQEELSTVLKSIALVNHCIDNQSKVISVVNRTVTSALQALWGQEYSFAYEPVYADEKKEVRVGVKPVIRKGDSLELSPDREGMAMRSVISWLVRYVLLKFQTSKSQVQVLDEHPKHLSIDKFDKFLAFIRDLADGTSDQFIFISHEGAMFPEETKLISAANGNTVTS